jgi:hypothetical protein
MIVPLPAPTKLRKVNYARLRYMQAELNPQPKKGTTMSASTFVAPSTTAEFMQRFPNYIEGWLRRRMDLTPDEMAELKASAVEYLAAKPTNPELVDNCEERIQMFAFSAIYETELTRFLSFVNILLMTWITSPTRKSSPKVALWLEVA